MQNTSETKNNSSFMQKSNYSKLNQQNNYISIDDIPLDNSDPINIIGNNQFLMEANKSGWMGDGSYQNPIVIQNLYFNEINANLTINFNFISIKNVDLYFVISRMYVSYLNSASLPRTSIELANCSNGMVVKSFFFSRDQISVFVDVSNSSNIYISDNYFSQGQGEVIVCTNVNSSIIENNFFKNSYNGIFVNEVANNITILNNTFLTNTNGINILSLDFSVRQMKEINIFNNLFDYNSRGISVVNGIANISNNLMTNTNFSDYGIRLSRAINSSVSGNVIFGYNVGIRVDSFLNVVKDQICLSNSAIPECSELSTISNQILILHQSNTTIFHNQLYDQNSSCIDIENNADGNIIYDNNFNIAQFDPSISLIHEGLDQNFTNAFYYNNNGNFYSNYNGTDNNSDGIGDSPYIINSNSQDSFPKINMVDIPKPQMTMETESEYTNRLVISSDGLTTYTLPTTSSSPDTNTGQGSTSSSNPIIYFDETESILIGTISITILSAGLYLVYEFRNYTKSVTPKASNKSFWKYITNKKNGTKTNAFDHQQLSEDTLDYLEEIIKENK